MSENKHNDGGPAFPGVHYRDDEGQEYASHGGMSLWDYYFGQCASGMLGNANLKRSASVELVFGTAANYADAMLAERAKRMGGSMSDSKHTPGPWVASCNEFGEWWVSASLVIAGVVSNDGYTQSPNIEADAHLIAAAPELLEALEDLLGLSYIADHAMDYEELEAARSAASDAIAKARGEA